MIGNYNLTELQVHFFVDRLSSAAVATLMIAD